MRTAQVRRVVGERMRELRTAAGLSLATAALRSGWHKSHLSRVERGLTMPSRALVSWYDGTLGADSALLRQFGELTAAAREDRETSRHDARHPVDVLVLPGGSVPVDFDPHDDCVFVAETVPDGTAVPTARSFLKSWTVRNAGTVPWHGRWLTRQGSPGVAGWMQSPRATPVPDTAPGELATIVLPLRAPDWPGSCTAYFKLTDECGRPYFPGAGVRPLHCTVLVEDT